MERLTKRLSNGEVMHNCGKCQKVNEKTFCSEKNCATVILNRLAELEDKLESGQLVELPCKVGDIVYYVDEYIAAEFDEVEVNTVEKIEIGKNEIRLWFGDDVGYVLVKNFGKEVFTDKSEAERRLAELKGGL